MWTTDRLRFQFNIFAFLRQLNEETIYNQAYQGTTRPEDAKGGNPEQDVEFSRGNSVPGSEAGGEEE
jgi:hypothetical protein